MSDSENLKDSDQCPIEEWQELKIVSLIASCMLLAFIFSLATILNKASLDEEGPTASAPDVQIRPKNL